MINQSKATLQQLNVAANLCQQYQQMEDTIETECKQVH